jgi:HB1, ASXL, restriction endonuclease HTH domain
MAKLQGAAKQRTGVWTFKVHLCRNLLTYVLCYGNLRKSVFLPLAQGDATVEKDEIEAAVLRAFEVSLEAQLKAVKRLQSGEPAEKPSRKGTSQVDMVYDVLKRAGRPLHVNEIIDRVEKLHGRKLERESIVSMLVKKIARGERFVRTDKRNEFGLKGGE